ncbi:hypothetical protein DQ04_02691010 [Trypanosoma grayi]|uniref:hypothetical protein n=1 Tax=Trypanosoma grayi TaxID=71804 RepID=UPI0004F3FA16|nr:hypothetical protein DQ04_02691010 [Trypanosoma grayi]KEG11368.1 hypothetical protein DQ04_02691010 [Trypanosoma grayi]
MVFALLRWIVTSVLFHAGLAYAAFVALRLPRNRSAAAAGGADSEDSSNSESNDASNKGSGKDLPFSSLKLWLMLSFLTSLSYVGAERIPFFLESRVLFTWLLLVVPPASHVKVYDSAFEPLLGRIGKAVYTLESNQLLARKAGLKIVRGCVELGLCVINYIRRCEALDADVIEGIESGLLHARGALREAELVRTSDSSPSFSPTAAVLSC